MSKQIALYKSSQGFLETIESEKCVMIINMGFTKFADKALRLPYEKYGIEEIAEEANTLAKLAECQIVIIDEDGEVFDLKGNKIDADPNSIDIRRAKALIKEFLEGLFEEEED